MPSPIPPAGNTPKSSPGNAFISSSNPIGSFNNRETEVGLGKKQMIVPRAVGATATTRLMNRKGETEESYLMRNLKAYQEKNPKALIVLNHVEENREGFVHPIFAYSVLDADNIKEGDKVHFIRSLKNLVKDIKMPYTERWLAALSLLGLPSKYYTDEEKKDILKDLNQGRSERPIRQIRDFAKAIPSDEVHAALKHLTQGQKGPSILRSLTKQVIKEAATVLKKQPDLNIQLEEDLDAYVPSLEEETGTENVPIVTFSDMIHATPVPQDEKDVGFGLGIDEKNVLKQSTEDLAVNSAEAEGMLNISFDGVTQSPTLKPNWPPDIIEDYVGEGRLEGMGTFPENTENELEDDWVWVSMRSIDETRRLMPEIVADVMSNVNETYQQVSEVTAATTKSWWAWGKGLVYGGSTSAENSENPSSITTDEPNEAKKSIEPENKPWKLL